MGGISNVGGAASAAGSSATSNASAGNSSLESSFNTALTEAQQTLTISTNGEAELNALRARPQ